MDRSERDRDRQTYRQVEAYTDRENEREKGRQPYIQTEGGTETVRQRDAEREAEIEVYVITVTEVDTNFGLVILSGCNQAWVY